jgi:hypothetical protein
MIVRYKFTSVHGRIGLITSSNVRINKIPTQLVFPFPPGGWAEKRKKLVLSCLYANI